MGGQGELGHSAMRFRNMHRVYLAMWLLCALIVIIMASWMSYVGASPDKYNDIHTNWEACLFQPNYIVGPTLSSIKLGSFINSLVFIGMIGVSMSLFGNVVMYWAWMNSKWSTPAAFFGLWCSLVGFTYYTPSPPLPIPSETNSTLFITMYWIKKHYFSDLSSECTQTYNFVAFYLAICFVMLFVMGMGTNMTFYFLYKKYKAMNISIMDELFQNSSRYPLVIFVNTLLMCFMYIGAFLGKVSSSVTAVDSYADSNHTPTPGKVTYPEIFFPFQPAMMSISSMCWAAIFVSVLYALTNRKENVRAYYAAAAASLMYVFTSYPSMVYLVQMYYQMDLDSDTVCENYFNSDENAAIYGYPSSGQSEAYCYSFRITSVLGVLLFVHMHFQTYFCYQIAEFNATKEESYLKDALLNENDKRLDIESSYLFPRLSEQEFKGGGKTNVL